MSGQLSRLLNRLLAAVLPGIVDGSNHLVKSWHIHASRRWPVGASEKWLLVWSQEHGHRPATSTTHQLHRLHINLINVWTFLSIYLDANKVAI